MDKIPFPSFNRSLHQRKHVKDSPSCSSVRKTIRAHAPHFGYLTDVSLAQLTGITFGLSISGAVFINTATNGLKDALPQIPVKELSQFVAGASSQIINSLSPEQHTLALDIIVESWNKTFICVYVAAAASLVVSIFFKVKLPLSCDRSGIITGFW